MRHYSCTAWLRLDVRYGSLSSHAGCSDYSDRSLVLKRLIFALPINSAVAFEDNKHELADVTLFHQDLALFVLLALEFFTDLFDNFSAKVLKKQYLELQVPRDMFSLLRSP
jgi:hypothetical protein